MARETRVPITLLRVVPQPYTVAERTAFDETAEALKRIADELASGDVEVEALVRRGEVVEEILQACREQAADLIVMRTHGRVGLGRAVLGSVTQRVLAESGVRLCCCASGGRQITHLRKLLVPIDGSPRAAPSHWVPPLDCVKPPAQHAPCWRWQSSPYVCVRGSEFHWGMGYIDPAWEE